MKKKKIWGITLAAIMVTSVIGSSTAVFAGEKTGGDIPPAQMAEVSQDKLLSEIDALADEYNRIYDSHIDLWDKLYDAYNSLEADYDFEDFDENTFIRSLKTMTEAEMDSLEEEYFRIYNSHSDLWEKVYDAEKDLPEDYDFEDYDEIEAIKGVKSLTEAEKAALIADIKKLDEIEKKLDELYKSVWGEDYGDDTIAFDDDNV
ncbi:MAG: hypothetical protein PUG78_00600 [Eubacteriales bacterium]|nr:hypothetical protein [Eubacteriales bacterium]